MTQRERQILNWIEANPLISQQELADKAGITRSSVAVHISNLMKKGYITGKGYIVHTAPYVTVVGGINMRPSAIILSRSGLPVGGVYTIGAAEAEALCRRVRPRVILPMLMPPTTVT